MLTLICFCSVTRTSSTPAGARRRDRPEVLDSIVLRPSLPTGEGRHRSFVIVLGSKCASRLYRCSQCFHSVLVPRQAVMVIVVVVLMSLVCVGCVCRDHNSSVQVEFLDVAVVGVRRCGSGELLMLLGVMDV